MRESHIVPDRQPNDGACFSAEAYNTLISTLCQIDEEFLTRLRCWFAIVVFAFMCSAQREPWLVVLMMRCAHLNFRMDNSHC